MLKQQGIVILFSVKKPIGDVCRFYIVHLTEEAE